MTTSEPDGRRPDQLQQLGEPIARGRTAGIYIWDARHVLNLFHEDVYRTIIEYEARAAAAASAAGLPAPAPGEIIAVANRLGIVYESVSGPTMLDLMLQKPWMALDCARTLASIQAQIHSAEVRTRLEPLRSKLELNIRRAQLPEISRAAALDALESMPDGRRLCHGDLHPANIVMSSRGPVIIDWLDASLGNPLADVARTVIIILGDGQHLLPGDHPLKPLIQSFHKAYLDTYFRLRPANREELSYWVTIVAAARLSENIPEVEQWLLDQASRCRPRPV